MASNVVHCDCLILDLFGLDEKEAKIVYIVRQEIFQCIITVVNDNVADHRFFFIHVLGETFFYHTLIVYCNQKANLFFICDHKNSNGIRGLGGCD